jgi:hypothetical protein
MFAPLAIVLAVASGAADAGVGDAGAAASQVVGDAGVVTEAPQGPVDLAPISKAIRRMQKACTTLKDFTAIFYKKEYKGRQLPDEVIFFKFRTEPRSLYLRWTGDSYKGQEVLWKSGWNGDRTRAHPGSFPDFTVNLGVDSWLATRYTRHQIPNAGFDFTIEMFARDLLVGRAKPECVIKAGEPVEQTLYDQPTHCYELETDKEKCPEMYAFKARLCVHDKLNLPVKVEAWDREDGELRLVEDYGYGDIKVDVGLKEEDFTPSNPNYGF